MYKTQPLAIEYWIDEFIYNLKKKTNVSILDLEEFYKKAFNLIISIERLRKSRDMWRGRYEQCNLKLKKIEHNQPMGV